MMVPGGTVRLKIMTKVTRCYTSHYKCNDKSFVVISTFFTFIEAYCGTKSFFALSIEYARSFCDDIVDQKIQLSIELFHCCSNLSGRVNRQ